MSKRSHYRREAADRDTPICPKCGNTAKETKTRYGIRSDCCRLWSWDRHPLVSAETHAARNRAHASFDALWKTGLIPRGKAYAILARHLGHPAHMKEMDAEEAGRVPSIALIMREEALSKMGPQ